MLSIADKQNFSFRTTPTQDNQESTSISVCNPDGSNISSSVNINNLSIGLQSSNSNVTSEPASTTVVKLLASNTNRKGFIILNQSSVSSLFIIFGNGNTYSNVLKRNMGYVCDLPVYTGDVYGYWDIADGNANVTEFT